MMAQPLSTPLDAAEMFTARGWVVFPCDHPDAGTHCTGTARACRERRCKAEADPSQRGKHPRVRWGDLGEPIDSGVLRSWFGRDAIPTNVAIACGPSGLLIVDEDEPGGFAAYCAHERHEIPRTFTVTTGRGQHWYFTVPVDAATGQRIPVGNAPGALAAWHCDVRGGASASATHGGYVITAGSMHASGHVYVAPEPYAAAVQAPGWLIEAILSPGPPATAEGPTAGAGTVGGVLRTSDGARWDDAPRYGTAQDLLGQFGRHCDEVTEPGGAFRHTLFRAARDGWRCVALGLLDEDAMLRELEACVWRVWQAEPDDDDHKIVFEEAVPAALASPWELSGTELRARAGPVEIEPGRTFLRSSEAANLADRSSTAPGVTSDDDPDDLSMVGNSTVAPATDREDELYAKDLVRKIRDERLRRDARDHVDALGLPDPTPLGYADFRASTRAQYLVPRMLYRNGLAVIFGAPGSGKTFLALDIAHTLATGRMWRGKRLTGRNGGPGMVHYVMAEGLDINLDRADAWTHYHEVDPALLEDHFTVFEEGILLTEPGIAKYRKHVQRDRPDIIFLDTKNALFMGKESAGEDFGAMIRVLHILRRDAGGCAIVLIDHSGLKDADRVRGSNAQQGGVHTEIMVSRDEETGLFTAKVKRDKATGSGYAQWHWRLFGIEELPHGEYMDPPAVCIPAELTDNLPFAVEGAWWLDDTSVPDAVAELRGRGRQYAQFVYKILRWVASSSGLTASDLKAAIEVVPAVEYDRTQFNRATALLETAGIIEHPLNSTARWVLASPYQDLDYRPGNAI